MGKAKESKLTTIVIHFDISKMRGLNQYLERKNIDLQKELEAYLEVLYNKHVPIPVREFISYQGELENENAGE